MDARNRFLNFVDRPTDPARFFEPHAHQRLREIKGAHDPSDLFRANHPIAPSGHAAAFSDGQRHVRHLEGGSANLRHHTDFIPVGR